MFNTLSSVVGGYFSNKFYLETYLVKMQIYHNDMPEMLKKVEGKKKCLMESLLKRYREMIGYDEFLNIKLMNGTYKSFRYKKRGDKYVITLNSSDDRFSEFVPREEVLLNKNQIFLGIYKPLAPFLCQLVPTKLPYHIYYRLSDEIDQLTKIWGDVEMLVLSVEALLEEIEVAVDLKI